MLYGWGGGAEISMGLKYVNTAVIAPSKIPVPLSGSWLLTSTVLLTASRSQSAVQRLYCLLKTLTWYASQDNLCIILITLFNYRDLKQ